MMRKVCILVPLLLLLPPVCGEMLGLRMAPFIHYSELKDWRSAQGHCRGTHTDLVTIRNAEENLAIAAQGWIGLHRVNHTSEWKWSRRDETANFTNFDRTTNYDGNCAFKQTDRITWDVHPCETVHSYICYDERLVLVKEAKTWEEALEHCRALEAVDPSKPTTAYQNHRYDLASLLTQDDHDFAQETAKGATTDEVWTGLRYLAGQWVWVEEGGGGVQYQGIKGCPTERFCGALLKTGAARFHIRDCTQRKNFLCYKKP